MDDENCGRRPAARGAASPEVESAWRELRMALAVQLGRMAEEGDHLLLEMPEGHGPGCTPYAQFAGFGSAMLRAELSGNAYLAAAHELTDEWCESLRMMGWRGNDETEGNWVLERPTADAGIIAAMVVGALREAFGVEHPQLLTYDALGPHAEQPVLLGLSATDDVLAELPASVAPQVTTQMPMDRSELIEMVRACLAAKVCDLLSVDDDGDFVLTHLGQQVWVRVRTDQPAVEIIARVTHGVHSRRATSAELAVLNRQHMWTIWVLSGRDVWMRLPIPALPFAPAHLDSMLDIFLAAMTETRDDLAVRVGGRVA